MMLVEGAQALVNLGIEGDRHAITDSSRQVLLIEKELLDELGLVPGVVKENITTRGIRLMQLKFKDRLQIGDEVELEITRPCSPCSRMDEIRPDLKLEIAGKRGMLARVVRGGHIRPGDPIQLLNA
jgi:MOSC domain-containing protein YiiM